MRVVVQRVRQTAAVSVTRRPGRSHDRPPPACSVPTCRSVARAKILLAAIASCVLATSCATLPPAASDGIVPAPSPNFDERRPNYVIIHQTSDDTAEEALSTLRNRERKVSAHYLIARDGTIYQLVSESSRAWHAGVSYWGGDTDLNSASIGIELDNNGEEPFADAQIARLLGLLHDLQQRYRIPQANFLAHGDVAPGRKVDPSRYFPWQRLADAGYGLWCRQPLAQVGGPADVDMALRILGYDMSNPVAALMAFRRHFLGIDSEAPADNNDRAMLNCLIRQKDISSMRREQPAE
jgi:N-acetylmuramoyl-L-alanine amidase